MNDVVAGRSLRMLRRRSRLRQVDVANRAGVSSSLVSLIERGHLATLSLRTVRRVFASVEADYLGIVRWRGGQLDRLLDEAHAGLVGRSIELVSSAGWEAAVEVTYSWYGERGSIDVLAIHRASRTALVVEVKSELTSIEATGRKLDEKVRASTRALVAERFGVRPALVARLLVLPDSDAARRRVHRHATVLGTLFPDRGTVVRRWLKRPSGAIAGILFVSDSNRGGTPRTSTRPIGPRRA